MSDLRPNATWQSLTSDKLYAGHLFPALAQYPTHIGLTIGQADSRNIAHDIRLPMPIPDQSIAIYQAEDVFEHVPYPDIPAILEDIYRALRSGGLFRLSVPDYRCDVLRGRSVTNDAGDIVFDPGGGGRFEGGRVVDGGHIWFPTIETVRSLFENSSFAHRGRVDYLHYTAPDGASVLKPIDYALGFVKRTPDNDPRVANPRRAMSIVVDAWKA